MPIQNTAGLNALKALSEGGSPALDAYRQAQASEQASRTSALNNALGGQDVAQAVAAAQAKYAPQVPTSGLSVDALAPAANSYLSDAATKLNDQNYQNQAKLTLQAAQLQRQKDSLSQQDIQNMMYGAADEMASRQKSQLSADPVAQLANQKATQRQQLTAFDQQSQGIPTPEFARAMQMSPEMIAQADAKDQQRGDILRSMAATDEQFKQAAGVYTGAIGTDAEGLLQRYNTESPAQVQDMINFLAPRQGEAARTIDMSGQERLRQLAPAFGINPMQAAGMFREGEGQDLQRAARLQQEQQYIEGVDKPAEQKQRMAEVMNTGNWSQIGDVTAAYIANDGMQETAPNGVVTKEYKGLTDFKKFIIDQVADATDDEGKPLTEAQKQELADIAMQYYRPKLEAHKLKVEEATAKENE